LTAAVRRRIMDRMRDPDQHLKFVNHELRNALAPLANYVEILKLQGCDPQTLALIVRQIARLQSIMDELLLGKSKDSASTTT
jgi:signal transduction histidine kinase